MPRSYRSRSCRTIGEFSASMRASSDRSFFVFFFILEQFSNSADLNHEIRHCADDSHHLCTVNDRIAGGIHADDRCVESRRPQDG